MFINEIFLGREARLDIYKTRRFGDCLHHQCSIFTFDYPDDGESVSEMSDFINI